MGALTIVFSVLMIILFIRLLDYLVSSPNTLQYLQNGQTASTIAALSLASNEVGSVNFAYSCWFFVNDWNYKYGRPKVIFYRMGGQTPAGEVNTIEGVSGIDPCPAVVLGSRENDLKVYLSCHGTTESASLLSMCEVSNIPIQKWVNLIISVYGRTMDIYIDGKLVRTCLLPGVPKINNNANIEVTPELGFDGWTSKLQYFPNSINPQDAWDIYIEGYSQNFLSNLFGSYQVQFSLIENGVTQNSVTI